MKKTILLFVSVLTLGLVSTSCSSDDDAEGASIVGKWEVSKEGTLVGTVEDLEVYEHACTTKDNIEFKANGTVVSSFYYGIDCISESDSGTYTKSGNTVTFTDEDGSYPFIIKELSATTLKFYDTYEEDGVQVTEIIVYTRTN